MVIFASFVATTYPIPTYSLRSREGGGVRPGTSVGAKYYSERAEEPRKKEAAKSRVWNHDVCMTRPEPEVRNNKGKTRRREKTRR